MEMVDPQKIELKLFERVMEPVSPILFGSENDQAEKGADAVPVDSYLHSPGLLAECLGEIKTALKST
jgi:hypothetical protein